MILAVAVVLVVLVRVSELPIAVSVSSSSPTWSSFYRADRRDTDMIAFSSYTVVVTWVVSCTCMMTAGVDEVERVEKIERVRRSRGSELMGSRELESVTARVRCRFLAYQWHSEGFSKVSDSKRQVRIKYRPHRLAASNIITRFNSGS